MNIVQNNSLEWLVGKSVIKIDDTLEHFLNQKKIAREFRNALQKFKNIPIEEILVKALEINFDDLSKLPTEFTFYAKDLALFEEAIQELSIASNNKG
ncbi:MAG: hypothetical protein ABID64_04410 [Nitrospirota bacterium]